MQTEQILTVALKLLVWTRTNAPDEREPRFGGQQAAAVLISLTRDVEPADDVDWVVLSLAEAVLRQYATHVHATTAYEPTPQQDAALAADEIRKKVLPPTAGDAEPAAEPVAEVRG